MKNKPSRLLKLISILLTVSISVSLFPTNSIIADSDSMPEATSSESTVTESFRYAIFTGSSSFDFTFNGWKSDILGDVYTGSNFHYNGSELTLDGTLYSVGNISANGWNINITNQEDNADIIAMPSWGLSILERGNDLPVIDTSRFTSEDPILTDGYCYVDGDIVISGTTFEGDAIIVASGDITYNINEISGNGRVLLYSENGDIAINGTEIDINGIVYAPNGRVSISANNTTLNGRIVSDEFFFSGSILNCYASEDDLDFLHSDSAITVTPTITLTATPVPSVEIVPTVTPGDTVTPTPTVIVSSQLDITIDTDQFIESEYDGLFYIFTPIETVTGTLSDATNVSSFTYSISSMYEENAVTGTLPIASSWSTNDIGFFFGPTLLVLTAETLDGQVCTKEYVFVSYTYFNAAALGVDIVTDSDEDGLPDYLENEIGTDAYSEDTDSDGLDDFVEVYIFFTNPLISDSDGNGVLDGDEDADNDGLTNVIELNLGTNPICADGDEDGLSDYQELNVYSTNPNDSDSDADGLSDGLEVSIGKNPLDAMDADVPVEQTVSESFADSDAAITSIEISMSYKADLYDVVQIMDLYDLDSYSMDVYGRIGSPIGLYSCIDFDVATLTIYYDESQLGDALEDNLGVLWYDDESGFFYEQTQAIVNTVDNTVEVELQHFSTYILVDLDKWNNPVIPDYSDYIYVVHEEMNDYICNAGVPSQDYLDREAWVWWRLSRSNIVKLATLNFEAINTRSIIYDFHFDWLVLDISDSNGNGIPDYIELHGILGTNRHIYSYEETQSRLGSRYVFYTDGRVFSDSNKNIIFDVSYKPNGNRNWVVYYDVKPSNDPEYLIDHDHDGLYANTPIYNANGEVILPRDPDDNFSNVPRHLVSSHFLRVYNGENVATYLTDNQANVRCSFEIDLDDGIVDNIESLWNGICDMFSDVVNLSVGTGGYGYLTLLGCCTLGFYDDNLEQAAHSRYWQWQRYGGYCNFYDSVFKIATGNEVDVLKLNSFTYNGEEYVFWGWRGNYLNLGTGGELGLYYIPSDNREDSITRDMSQLINRITRIILGGSDSSSWWSVAPYEIDMELHIYDNDIGFYSPVLNWAPDDNQWWITGFNYDTSFWNPNVEEIYYIATINFNDVTSSGVPVDGSGLYNAFRNDSLANRYNVGEGELVIFDDDSLVVYIVWGSGIDGKIYVG